MVCMGGSFLLDEISLWTPVWIWEMCAPSNLYLHLVKFSYCFTCRPFVFGVLMSKKEVTWWKPMSVALIQRNSLWSFISRHCQFQLGWVTSGLTVFSAHAETTIQWRLKKSYRNSPKGRWQNFYYTCGFGFFFFSSLLQDSYSHNLWQGHLWVSRREQSFQIHSFHYYHLKIECKSTQCVILVCRG